MIKVEKIEVFNLEGAIRGMRNPHDSWGKSDSFECFGECRKEGCPKYNKKYDCCNSGTRFIVGKNDMELMQSLYKGGTPHRKFMRQIFVSMDITAPRYWWQQMDTYKVGVTTDSCSTMHTIEKHEFTLDDFSHDYLDKLSGDDYNIALKDWNDTIMNLNKFRKKYLESRSKAHWMQLIEKLPQSYNQKRTVTMDYENAVTIIKWRTGHKLDEWNDFIIKLYNLPHMKDIMEGTE